MSYSLNSLTVSYFLKDKNSCTKKVIPELTQQYKQSIADMKSKMTSLNFTAPGIEIYQEGDDNPDYEETTDLDEIMSGS